MKTALYPGSFDALTYGHLDMIERACSMFDKVYVAIARNIEKNPLFTVEERIGMIREITKGISNINVVSFDELTVDFAKKIEAKFIIRGLRAVSDFEYELQMALVNRELKPDIETIFLAPAKNYIFLSSRVVKEVLKFRGDISGMVPPLVETQMKKVFEEKKLYAI